MVSKWKILTILAFKTTSLWPERNLILCDKSNCRRKKKIYAVGHELPVSMCNVCTAPHCCDWRTGKQYPSQYKSIKYMLFGAQEHKAQMIKPFKYLKEVTKYLKVAVSPTSSEKHQVRNVPMCTIQRWCLSPEISRLNVQNGEVWFRTLIF